MVVVVHHVWALSVFGTSLCLMPISFWFTQHFLVLIRPSWHSDFPFMALNTRVRERERERENREREQNSALGEHDIKAVRDWERGRKEGRRERQERRWNKVQIQSLEGKQETCGALDRLIVGTKSREANHGGDYCTHGTCPTTNSGAVSKALVIVLFSRGIKGVQKLKFYCT